jgi:hypothetical protein
MQLLEVLTSNEDFQKTIGKDQILFKSFLSCSRHFVTVRYTKNYCTKVLNLPKICIHTSLYGPTASGNRVDPTSQVFFVRHVVLPMTETCKVQFWRVPDGVTSISNLIQIRPAVLKLNIEAERWTGPQTNNGGTPNISSHCCYTSPSLPCCKLWACEHPTHRTEHLYTQHRALHEVRTHVHMYVCIYVRMNVCVRGCMYVYM